MYHTATRDSAQPPNSTNNPVLRHSQEFGGSDRFPFTDTPSLIIQANGRYMSEFMPPARELPKRMFLFGYTGLGKNYWAASLGYVVIVCPTLANLDQMAHDYSAARFSGQHKEVNADSRVIVVTPDSLSALTRQIDVSLYTLFVDESHNLTKAKYRAAAYNRVMNSLSRSWDRIILATGTPVPIVGPLGNFDTVVIDAEPREQNAQIVIYNRAVNVPDKETGKTKEVLVGDLYQAISKNVEDDGVDFIWINSKGAMLNRLLHQLWTDHKLKKQDVVLINADSRDNPQYSDSYISIIEDAEIPSDAKIVISTRLISEGININTDVRRVHMCGQFDHVDAQQTAARFRSKAPDMVFFYVSCKSKKTNDVQAEDTGTTLDRIMGMVDGIMGFYCESSGLIGDGKLDQFKEYDRLASATFVNLVKVVDGQHMLTPDYVSISSYIYKIETAKEKDTDVLKARLEIYGYKWKEDVESVTDTVDIKKREAHVEKRGDQKFLDRLPTIRRLSEMSIDEIKFMEGEQSEARSARNEAGLILDFYNLGMRFDAAILLNLWSESSSKSKRLYRCARNILQPIPIIVGAFEIGDELTSAQIRAKLIRVYGEHDHLKLRDGFEKENFKVSHAMKTIREWFTISKHRKKTDEKNKTLYRIDAIGASIYKVRRPDTNSKSGVIIEDSIHLKDVLESLEPPFSLFSLKDNGFGGSKCEVATDTGGSVIDTEETDLTVPHVRDELADLEEKDNRGGCHGGELDVQLTFTFDSTIPSKQVRKTHNYSPHLEGVSDDAHPTLLSLFPSEVTS